MKPEQNILSSPAQSTFLNLPEDITHSQSKPVQPGAHGQNIVSRYTLSTKTSLIPLPDNTATEHHSNSTHCLTAYKKIYHFHIAM
jgi:hypothetical protein